MRPLRIAGIGINALATHKLRTFLMMAGTLVGVAALTVVMAMGKGTERKIMKRVENFGPRAIMLIAGGGKDVPGPDLTTTTLTLRDAEAIRQDVSGIEAIAPAAMHRQKSIKAGSAQTQATVFACGSNWHDAWDWHARLGDGITDDDNAMMARVCVIGQTVRDDLFPDIAPIGQYLHIGNVRFQVKGVLEKRGTSPMGTDFDNRLLIPLTTGMRRVFNQDHLSYVRIKVADVSQLKQVARQVRQLIHERHRIGPAEEDDFRLITAEIVARFAAGSSRTLSILLAVLAGLSLLVGGVVLMNILLISVKERTKEIGLRRAIGASRRDVFAQFLAESLTVTLLGMAAGLLVGWGICVVLPRFTQVPLAMSWESIALAAGAAAVVGTFFGIQPARRAARLDPVEALR
jgi:putative ABC transport system permease protein